MGCDAHMFVEFRKRNADNDWDSRWKSVAAKLWEPRDYLLFGHLAGVRYDPTDGPVAEPRGYPDLDYFGALDEVSLRVRPDDEDMDIGERSCTVSQARQWGGHFVPGYGPDTQYPRVYDPDLHTPTWLTTAEYKEALRRAEADPCGKEDGLEYAVEAPYWAYAALMCELEKRGYEARIIIAFDN